MDRNLMKIKSCPATIHPKWYISGFFDPKKTQYKTIEGIRYDVDYLK
jgi:hypothetical protein